MRSYDRTDHAPVGLFLRVIFRQLSASISRSSGVVACWSISASMFLALFTRLTRVSMACALLLVRWTGVTIPSRNVRTGVIFSRPPSKAWRPAYPAAFTQIFERIKYHVRM